MKYLNRVRVSPDIGALLVALSVFGAVLWMAATSVNTPSAFATADQTATVLAQTPHPDRRDADIRSLNEMSRPGGPKVGDMLAALWHGRQTGGTPTASGSAATVDVSAITAMVNGIYSTKTAAAGTAMTGCATTNGTTFRKCTLCLTGGLNGTLTWRSGADATSAAAAIQPACRDYEVEVMVVAIPVSYTTVVTNVQQAWFSVPTPRAQGVQF